MPLESRLTVMNSPTALISFTGIKGYRIFCGDSVKWGKKAEIKVKKSDVVRDIHLVDHITSLTILCTNNRVGFWHI